MRTYKFQFTVECASAGTANIDEVEKLIDLTMQELVYDDRFVEALGESEAVTIQVQQIG